jgi:hypothetical protein
MTFSELHDALHGSDPGAFYTAVMQIAHMSTRMHEAWHEYLVLRQG